MDHIDISTQESLPLDIAVALLLRNMNSMRSEMRPIPYES